MLPYMHLLFGKNLPIWRLRTSCRKKFMNWHEASPGTVTGSSVTRTIRFWWASVARFSSRSLSRGVNSADVGFVFIHFEFAYYKHNGLAASHIHNSISLFFASPLKWILKLFFCLWTYSAAKLCVYHWRWSDNHFAIKSRTRVPCARRRIVSSIVQRGSKIGTHLSNVWPLRDPDLERYHILSKFVSNFFFKCKRPQKTEGPHKIASVCQHERTRPNTL